MSTQIRPYTPLKTCVSMALDEMQRGSGDFDRYWVLAFRALVNMTYSVAGQPVTMRLPVLPNKTVKLPPNCLSWTKVGLLNERGEIETLRVNNGLTSFKALDPQRLDGLAPDVSDGGGLVYRNYYADGHCYALFGAVQPVVTHGECKVDEKLGVILLAPDFRYDSVLLECLDVPEQNEDYQIPTCLQEAVIAFIKWKDKAGTMQEYYAAVTEGRRSLPKKRVVLQTLHQVLRDSHGQKLKA